MQVEKSVTINIGGYQSLKIGVIGAPSFEEADKAIIGELERLKLPVNKTIQQCFLWQADINTWM